MATGAFCTMRSSMHSMYRGEDEMLGVLDTLALAEDLMFVVDDHNRIVFWNRAVEDVLGYSHDEVAGRSCAVLGGDDYFGNRYCSDACPVHQLAQRGDAIRQFRLRFRPKKGQAPVTLDVNVVKFTLRSSRRTLLAHFMRPALEAEEGGSVPPQRVVTREHTDARIRNLTTREVEILGLLARGRHTREIAALLGIAPLTTRNHIQHIMTKIEVHSQSEAVAFAYKMHLV